MFFEILDKTTHSIFPRYLGLGSPGACVQSRYQLSASPACLQYSIGDRKKSPEASTLNLLTESPHFLNYLKLNFLQIFQNQS